MLKLVWYNSSDLRYNFPAKNTFRTWKHYARGNRVILNSIKRLWIKKVKKTKKQILHLRVIISREAIIRLLCSKPEVQRTPLHAVIDATIWRLHDRRDATNVIEEHKTDRNPADNVAPHNDRVCVWGCWTSGTAS